MAFSGGKQTFEVRVELGDLEVREEHDRDGLRT